MFSIVDSRRGIRSAIKEIYDPQTAECFEARPGYQEVLRRVRLIMLFCTYVRTAALNEYSKRQKLNIALKVSVIYYFDTIYRIYNFNAEALQNVPGRILFKMNMARNKNSTSLLKSNYKMH